MGSRPPIKIPQPAIVLNSQHFPSTKPGGYKMANTYDVSASHSPSHMLGWAAEVMKGFKKDGAQTITMVINCHGRENITYDDKGNVTRHGGFGLRIGTGIHTADDVNCFRQVMPYVDYIILTACRIAEITNRGDTWNGDGNLFCCAIAKAAASVLYCSSGTQFFTPEQDIPTNCIDALNGSWFRYNALGNCDFHGNFPNDKW